MNLNKSYIRIDNVEKIELYPCFNEDCKHRNSEVSNNVLPVIKESKKNNIGTPHPKHEKIYKRIDLIGKYISILSSIGIITVVIFQIIGKTTIGPIQSTTLLTIVSITFIGGIISVGGVQLFSINASLRKNQSKIDNLIKQNLICPFESLIKDGINDNLTNYRPGNPRFCAKCPLFPESSNIQIDNIICRVFNEHHEAFKNGYKK